MLMLTGLRDLRWSGACGIPGSLARSELVEPRAKRLVLRPACPEQVASRRAQDERVSRTVIRTTSVEPDLPRAGDEVGLRRVTVEGLEPGALLGSQIVLDIILQVAGADGLAGGRIGEVVPRDRLRLRDAGAPGPRPRLDVGSGHRVRPPRPECIHERQPGHCRPR